MDVFCDTMLAMTWGYIVVSFAFLVWRIRWER